MVQKREQHSDEFKAKVALEAIKGVRTAGQLSSVFGIHPMQIANWKRQLVEGAPGYSILRTATAGRPKRN